MVKNEVWDVVDKNSIPKGADIIDSMWATKKKAHRDYRACLVAQGFKQTQGKSFVHHNISSPVVHNITVQIVLVLMLMGGFAAHLVDMNGAFLLGQAQRKDIYENPIGIQKVLSIRWTVVFETHFIWCKECS